MELHPRPWRLDDEKLGEGFWGDRHRHDTGYGRTSAAIVDANNEPVLFLDPSMGEYARGCTKNAARLIVALANGEPPQDEA